MEIPFELEGSFKHYREERKIDLEKVKLYIEPDFKNEIVKVNSELTLKALIDKVDEIKLDAVSFKIKRISLDKESNPKFDYDGKRIRIFLREKLNQFEKIKVNIDYEIKPRKGLYFIKPTEENPKKPLQIWSQGEDEDSRYWYPCIDLPEEKITSEVIVKVPKGFKAISNGYLISVVEEENSSVFHWKMDKPFAPYLLTLVIGEYEEIKEEWEGVTIIHYTPKERIEDVKESYKETKDILDFFSKYLDFKYPFEKYANVPVEDFIFGGMENITATTLTSTSIYDKVARLDMSAESLLAHEIAHTWFGDIITCKEWAHIWLNEGFATYFQALYKEFSKGWDEFIYNMLQKFDSYLEESKNYKRAIVTKVFAAPTELFDRHTYEKGSLVLHLLRYELGDEMFRKVMRNYLNKYKFSVATTEDFRQVIEETTGLTFEKFFDQFVYQPGHPILKFNWKYEDKRLKVTFIQETDKPYEINLDLFIRLKDKEILEKISLKDKIESFVYNFEEKPQYIDLDPYGWLLIANIIREDNLENLIEIVYNGKTSISKIRAIRALKEKNDERVVECLSSALFNEKFWAVRAEAAKTLATIKSNSSVEALLKAINDKEPKVRKEVAKALGEFKDEKIIEALKKIAKEGESYGEREQAIISLGKQKREELLSFIMDFLNFESHADIIRSASLKALGEIKNIKTIETLKEFTKNKYSVQARTAAVESLGKYLRDNPAMFDDYVKFLEDSFYRVRITAIKALEQLGEEKCIPYLRKVIEQDLDNRVVRAAKEAIYRINEQIKNKTELKNLRDEIEKLKKENEELKSKLATLESKIK
jgi:Aminopeptidase N